MTRRKPLDFSATYAPGVLKWLVEINQSMITTKEEIEARLRSEVERIQQENQDDLEEEILRRSREILEEQRRQQQLYTAAERQQPGWVEVRLFGNCTISSCRSLSHFLCLLWDSLTRWATIAHLPTCQNRMDDGEQESGRGLMTRRYCI